jgi:tetratricopeptide (TPR) repeat protein
MGVVYLVRHRQMNRSEALKMILAGEHACPADLARFQAEARTVASLNHSNFVQIYDVGESDGHPYLRLEYVSGGNLEDWLDRQLDTSCLAPGVAARHVECLARAMHHMHEKGLVHRDLKPANVLVSLPDDAGATPKLEDCELKISDFGLARNVRGPGLNTRGIIGTPAYMAPEQATGSAVDRRADVYSLGAILYRLLTGRPPIEGENPLSVLAQLIQPEHEPVPPSQLRPNLPPELDHICLRSLAKDPALRQPSAKELAEDLHLFQASWSGTVPAGSSPAPARLASPPAVAPPTVAISDVPAPAGPRRRPVGRMAALAALAVALAVAAYFGYSRWSAVSADRQAVDRQVKALAEAETEARSSLEEAKVAHDKGDRKNALRSYWKAQEEFEDLHKHYPDRADYVLGLARAHLDEGSLWLDCRNTKEAEEDFTTAVELLTKEIAPRAAGDDVSLALADAYHLRGTLQVFLRQWRPALGLYEEALKIREGLFWKNKNDRAFRRDLARSLSSIGDAQLQLGRQGQAYSSYDEAEKVRRQLVAEEGGDSEARLQLARSIANKGKYYLWRGDLAGSVKNYTEALHAYEALTSAQPDFVLYRSELADNYLWLAELHLDRNEPDEARGMIEKAATTFEELSTRGADEVIIRGGRVRCIVLRARTHALVDPAKGAEDAGKAVTQFEELSRYVNTEQRQLTADDRYVWAAARALAGDKEAALRTLKAAITNYTFRNFARLHADVAFRPLLDKDPDFKKAVDELEKAAKRADTAEQEESEAASAAKS